MAAMQLAAILALAGTPAPRANAHVPTMKLSVVRPYNPFRHTHIIGVPLNHEKSMQRTHTHTQIS